MINHREAEQIILQNIPQPKFENVEISSSLNRVLAENIISPENSPLFNNSAMDGFAVKWDEVKTLTEKGNILLKIIGETKAGTPFNGDGDKNSAVQISTGAMMPAGYDSVIPIEDVDIIDGNIQINSVRKEGQHVRIAGEEFHKGDILIEKDSIITPAIIGLLASVGISEILCYQHPQIAIITTGSELVNYKDKLSEGEIRNSNELMLVSAVKNLNADIILTVNAKDNLNVTIQAIKDAVMVSEIILISGGVSVGPHDHVKTASKESGFETIFWKVNQKPGKPFFFAKRNKTLLFGLPGNPVSALMNFVKYVSPIIKTLSGYNGDLDSITAKSSVEISNTGSRTNLVQVKIRKKKENYFVELLLKQGSHMISSISTADGFIILEPGEKINTNDLVNVKLFPWRNKWDI